MLNRRTLGAALAAILSWPRRTIAAPAPVPLPPPMSPASAAPEPAPPLDLATLQAEYEANHRGWLSVWRDRNPGDVGFSHANPSGIIKLPGERIRYQTEMMPAMTDEQRPEAVRAVFAMARIESLMAAEIERARVASPLVAAFDRSTLKKISDQQMERLREHAVGRKRRLDEAWETASWAAHAYIVDCESYCVPIDYERAARIQEKAWDDVMRRPA